MQERFGLETKKLMADELKSKFQETPNFIITNYKGLSSQKIEELRRTLRKAEASYFVVKNSLLKKVLNELKLTGLDDYVKGELGVSFVKNSVEACRQLLNFTKENAALKLCSAYFDGKAEDANTVKTIAMLPPKNVLMAMILSQLHAPISGFVYTLKGLLRNLVSVLDETRKRKEGKVNDKL